MAVPAVTAAGAEPVVLDLEALAGVAALADAARGADAVVFAAGAGPGSGIPRKDTVDRAASVLCAQAAQDAANGMNGQQGQQGQQPGQQAGQWNNGGNNQGNNQGKWNGQAARAGRWPPRRHQPIWTLPAVPVATASGLMMANVLVMNPRLCPCRRAAPPAARRKGP